MGLLDRSKRIVDIKRDNRKKQREGSVDTGVKTGSIGEGTIGDFNGLDFTVLGRIVYDWGGGSWEEFYLEFVDTEEYKWLSKEGTTMELLVEVESSDAPDPENLSEGDLFELTDEKVKVIEVGEAKITSVSGSFPWNIASGTEVIYADCEFERTGETLSLEKPKGSRIEVYRGNEVSKGSLNFY